MQIFLLINATSYELLATPEAGAVAALAERKKMTKYETIAQTYLFCPIATETSDVFGPVASSTILQDLARQIKGVSKEPNSRAYLLQKISIAVQRGNAAPVMGCAGLDLDEV